jgi:hypothetical protein
MSLGALLNGNFFEWNLKAKQVDYVRTFVKLIIFIIIIIIIIIVIMAIVRFWLLFQFHNLVHSRFDFLDGRPALRRAGIYAQDNTNTG